MQANGPGMPISYDARNASFTSSQGGGGQMMYAPPQPNPMGSYRSFSDMNGHSQHQMNSQPQIYTAVYSGVSVYEMEINGVAVMRRRSDSWLNATQILKVAGVDKGKRTKVLEKEVQNGEHEKVQGGYGKYQGTWINYRRGREFCRQYGVEEILRPLLDHDINADGSGQAGQGIDTPTKEQAMAANRKRFYSQSQDNRQSQGSQGGTFFSNLSSTASNAISAMTKAARLNTPSRPNSAQRRPGSAAQRSLPNSQESFRGAQNSQQSMPGLPTDRSFNASDSAYMTQAGIDQTLHDSQEPPRKRMRGGSPSVSFSQGNGDMDVMMRDGTPTEPNDSFLYRPSSQLMPMEGEVPIALPPLPHPQSKSAEEKQSLLLDLFADLNRTDFTSHDAIRLLSGSDLDLPLDQSANTALHWAATLARVPLMRLLLSRGASIFRGNIAGETPLMAAVQVNNNLDHACFPELLDILSPLIEIRDTKGRTILHHIAVACGIKGRAASSKYYLEALLEFLVRGNSSSSQAPSSSMDGSNGNLPKPIGLMRFMSEMVNARDISGNTALNLVARIGNRSIIRQLVEVQADPTIPNHKGLRPVDFGVEPRQPEGVEQMSQSALESPNKQKSPSKAEEVSREMMPSLTSSMTEMQSQFSNELRSVQERVDTTTFQIRELSTQQTTLSTQVETAQARHRARQERKQRIQNFRRAVIDMRDRVGPSKSNGPRTSSTPPLLTVGDADREFSIPNPSSQHSSANLLDTTTLNAHFSTYKSLNASLAAHHMSLKARDTELEHKYRKVVSLCTDVPEANVDSVLPQLVLAVESETENEVGRIREFLNKYQQQNGGPE